MLEQRQKECFSILEFCSRSQFFGRGKALKNFLQYTKHDFHPTLSYMIFQQEPILSSFMSTYCNRRGWNGQTNTLRAVSVLCTTFAAVLPISCTKSRHDNGTVTGDIIIPDQLELASLFVLMLLNKQAKQSAGVNSKRTTAS